MAKWHCITSDDISLIIEIWHYYIWWHHQCHWKCLKKKSYSLLSFWSLKGDPVLLLQVKNIKFVWHHSDLWKVTLYFMTSFWLLQSETLVDFVTSFWCVKSDTVLLPQVQNIKFWMTSFWSLKSKTVFYDINLTVAKWDPSRFYDIILMCEKWHCITVTSTKY